MNDTTPQSSVPSAPTREEVDKLLAPYEWAEKYADIGLKPRTKNAEFLCAAKSIFAALRTLSADHARLKEDYGWTCGMLRDACAERDRLSAQLSAQSRMVADFPKLMDFFSRNALPSLDEPSCLMCGHVGERSTTHGDLPSIYICKTCVFERAAQSERIAALEKDAARYRWLKSEDNKSWVDGLPRGYPLATVSWRNLAGQLCAIAPDENLDGLIDAARLDAPSTSPAVSDEQGEVK